MKSWLSLVMICGWACLTLAQDPEAKTEKKDPSFWMKKKLEYSQKAFQALALGDFDAIQEASAKLETLNAVEEFVRQRNPRYRTQLEIFKFANEELTKQAEKKNIEGAALAFHQLTLSCVNCHRELRNEVKEGK